jgi:hypothetical protein
VFLVAAAFMRAAKKLILNSLKIDILMEYFFKI